MDGLQINLEQDLHRGDASVERFALHVVRQVVGGGCIDRGEPARDMLALMVRHARTGHPELLDMIVRRITAERIPAERVVDVYIPKAAYRIGAAWHAGELDVLGTSVAIARLQALLRVIGRAWIADAAPVGADLRVLLTVPQGEQHTLGAIIASHQLRRLGVSVKLEFMPSTRRLAQIVAENEFDAVMISVANRSLLEPSRKMVKTIKRDSVVSVPVIIGGPLAVEMPGLADDTGADYATTCIAEALSATGLIHQDRAAQ